MWFITQLLNDHVSWIVVLKRQIRWEYIHEWCVFGDFKEALSYVFSRR